MIDEHQEEMAALHAFDLLDGEDRERFMAELARSPSSKGSLRSCALQAHPSHMRLPRPSLPPNSRPGSWPRLPLSSGKQASPRTIYPRELSFRSAA